MKYLLLFALLALFKGSLSQCPSDWVQYQQKCYYFSNVGSIPLSWHEAQSKCESWRASLVVIETEDENTFLYNQLPEVSYYYIGLHDLNGENQWQWVDGSSLQFILWGQGQPDNWQGAIGSQEDCVEMVQDQGGAWNDLACSLRHDFICERDLNIEPFPNCREEEGWEEFDQRCYKVFSNPLPWSGAEASCVSEGGNLVAITGDTEQLYVAGKVNEWATYMWIGLSSVDSSSSTNLHWSNGADPDPGFSNWGANEPNYNQSPTATNCAGIDPSIATNGPWSIKRCGDAHAYMCETGLTGSCAPGWYYYKDNCYFQASTQQLWTSWVGAKAYCEVVGASLVKVDNPDKQEYINSRLPDIADGGSLDVWIGASDSESDGVFVWTDGTTATEASYTYWQSNQPRNRPDAWDCAQIFTGSSWGGWEVDDCYKQQAFICEIPPGMDVKPNNPIGPGPTGCDPGWLYYGGHCYYFEYLKEITWQQAEDDCIRYGAHLVSIISGEENAFVTGHMSGSSWLGAHDNQGEGRFEWTDRMPFNFTNWYPGEPNNNDGTGDCVQLWMDAGYMWDDVGCDQKKGYACKAVPHECDQALGMEKRVIPDYDITASSQWNENHAPYHGRLNNHKSGDMIGAWVPEKQGDNFAPGGTDWIQVHLVPERTVTGITTQGRPADFNQYVKSYIIKYSNDGVNFQQIGGTFFGNTDTYTPVTNRLPQSIVTSYIRLYPMSWQESPTLRMEILGCNSEGADLATPSPDGECTSVAVNERLDCGYPGINGQECLNKGCCWDKTQPAIWCFYKKGDYDTRCGKDWSFDPGGQFLCYHFNDLKKRTWSQAREYCISMGGDLLSINSQHEQAYVTAHVSSLVLTNSLWIGVNNLDAESGWKWSNGAAYNFVNWNTGEPNGYDNDENCVEMYTSNGKWNDVACNQEFGIACKKIADTAPPDVSGNGNIALNICEGETATLACTGNTVIVVHHAIYGRTDDFTCGEGNLIPEGGCVAENSLDIVSAKCNNLDRCDIAATNEIFGDPCHETYKYLNVIYSCESKSCYDQLGVENGTVTDAQMSASSSTDNSHKATDGRLNGQSGWKSNENSGAWIQVTFPQKIRISGVITQGIKDSSMYVTKFKIAFANDDTFTQWTDYTDFDKNVVMFDGNADSNTAKRSVLAEHVFTSGIRIYPLEWEGEMVGMRIELTGCNPLRALGCGEIGDVILTVDEGEIVQAECPGFCPFLVDNVEVYGTNIYAGNSQICNAAVHAGVIIDRFGGPVTMIRKPSQSAYQGSVKNALTSFDQNYYPVAFAFTSNEKNCQAGWVPYLSHCYYLSDYSLTWTESEAVCVAEGGHLASIYDEVEQDFILQLVHRYQFRNVWIGLNELRTVNTYEWTDGEPVTYTNWNRQEPNNWEGRAEPCVTMYQDDSEGYRIPGRWNDDLCDNVYGFICKKFKSYYTESEAAHPTPAPGCQEGWQPYDYMCYHFNRDLMVEEDAEAYCEAQGGVTVHVQNKYVQSFIHTVVGAEDFRWWIGLHAVVSEDTGIAWQWESGDPVVYDNWAPNNPTVNAGECVVIYGGAFGFGFWYSQRCDEKAFVICEAPREGFTPPPPTTPPPVDGCYYDWSNPGSDANSCYKVYSPANTDQNTQKQSWNNAFHQCTAHNADLASIHSKEEEEYLIREIGKLELVTDYVWIGLNNKGDGEWKWSDGSSIQYLNWNPGFPSQNIEHNCVMMKYEKATGRGFWENYDCQQHLDWICKIPKGIEVVEPTEPPTGFPDLSCGSPEDGLWIRFDSICYLFDNSTTADIYTAERKCQQTGSNLASIHSNREQAFITNVLQSISSISRFWIGLREIGGINGEYMWSDGTPLDFVYWNQGEPNDGGGMEQCVAMYKSDGRWNDANCGMKYAGFICKNGPTVVTPPTSPASGGCENGWYLYGNYCYRIMGDASVCDPQITDDPLCSADFGSAQLQCNEMDADLVSIHNKYENAFLTAQSYRAINNLWIGLSSYQWNGKPFVWANGDEVTYVNWNNGEPNSVDGSEHCVEMYRVEPIAGRWNDNQCDLNVPYICMKERDPNIPDGQEINNNRKCKSGWMQYDTVNGHYVCLFLDTTPRSFDVAQENCMNMGANLASVQTNWELAFLTSYIKDQPAWLGMKLNPDTYEWVWIDQWPLWITNWGEAQPGSDYSKDCVLSKDSVLGTEWITASCLEQHMSVCKYSTETLPTTPGYVEGYCQDPSWVEYGGYCFFVNVIEGNELFEGATWADAELSCNNYNGHLVSFTSRAEQEWALGWYNYSESLWIGLKDNGQGGWSWTDFRPVSFTYWATGEPNNAGEEGEDCVEMLGSGEWNDLSCMNLKGYMCRIPKVIGTDEDGNIIHYTTPAPPEDIKPNNAGIIAGAVIGALLALALVVGIAVYCTRSSTNVSKLVEDASELPSGFVNKLYSVASNVTGSPGSSSTDTEVKFDKESGATFEENMSSA